MTVTDVDAGEDRTIVSESARDEPTSTVVSMLAEGSIGAPRPPPRAVITCRNSTITRNVANDVVGKMSFARLNKDRSQLKTKSY